MIKLDKCFCRKRQPNQLMPSFDVPDYAARLTSNTRHMLSRLGFGLNADDKHTGVIVASDEAENEASTERQHRKEQLPGGEKHVTTAADGLDNDNDFQEELERVFRLAVRADSTSEREFMGTLSHTAKDLREEEVMVSSTHSDTTRSLNQNPNSSAELQ